MKGTGRLPPRTLPPLEVRLPVTAALNVVFPVSASVCERARKPSRLVISRFTVKNRVVKPFAGHDDMTYFRLFPR